jgi:spermidine/putrescine transport system permease protein
VSLTHASPSTTGGRTVSPSSGGLLVRLRRLRWSRYSLVAIVVAYLTWSLAPVFTAFLFSFNSGYSRSIWQGFSLRWWTGPASVFHDRMYYDAMRHSLVLAVLAVLITVPLGVSLSIFLSRWRGVTSKPAAFLSTVPLVVPELVLALAMLFLVTKLLHFVALGTTAQVAGQVTFILPLVIVITRGRLASIPIGFEEAAMDLGASPMQAFRLALIPLLQPAILASAIVAFAVSIDDFVITQYMSSTAATESVPMLIYTATRGTATPALNAMATVMAVTTVVVTGVGYILYRFVARSEEIPAIAREDVPAIPALGEGAA